MNLNYRSKRKYSEIEKDKSRKYYLLGLNLQEVSKLMDIPKKTLEKWQQKYSWKDLKVNNLTKTKAVELKEKGFSSKEISSILKISLTTVWRYCK